MLSLIFTALLHESRLLRVCAEDHLLVLQDERPGRAARARPGVRLCDRPRDCRALYMATPPQLTGTSMQYHSGLHTGRVPRVYGAIPGGYSENPDDAQSHDMMAR